MLVRAGAAVSGLAGLRRLWRGGGSGAAACFPLGRALLGVRGADAAVFLQGLLTNDVTRLVAGDATRAAAVPRALYAHALSVQGRCLYDLILYRLHESPGEEPHILLECDGGVLDAIQKHLKLYKIRRKVNIAPCLDLSLWAVVPGELAGDIAASIAKCGDQAVVLTPDPRTEVMGWRLITKKGANLSEIIPGSHIGNIQDYHTHRNSRRCEGSPSRSRPPAGIKPRLHERHQLHQRLLRGTGADGPDPPRGCHSQTFAAGSLRVPSPRGQRFRGCRDLNRSG
ncbi:putative transferase CAF17, mitochondrial isoform X4 [Patagioenas fasciata]|uniref:putative transferase CAF17, mitochondrial isoform X4 n=1 Tax=Patagioenas fasciata TaxID=372321 RepID=UPI0032E92A88